MNRQIFVVENDLEYLITCDKDGVEKTRYCLELNPEIWQPKYPGDICPEYMLRYCQAKGYEDLAWYVKILEDPFEKPKKKSKSTGEVVQTITRKRTPSEVKQAFIKKYFPDMKRVKDEKYEGHATKAKKLLEEMAATQQPSAPKKAAAPKAEQPKE